MKFIHLTDTHLVAGGGDLYGTNPKDRLERAVAHIRDHQADADALIITGDLTHKGQANAYEHFRECLAPLTMPIHLILGNHDNRSIFRTYFDTPTDDHGFVQYAQDFGTHHAIFLDTNEPGVHWGVFCEQRAAWLRRQLDSSTGPVLLFMHHPFFPIGIASMDTISLLETAPFFSAIAGHEHRLHHVFFGHIHRPICGSFRRIPYSTLRGTNHQVSLMLDDHDISDIVGSHEPPQYAVVLLRDEQVLIHVEDYMDTSKRFPLLEKLPA